MLTNLLTFDEVNKFRDLRASCPLSAILRAHHYIIALIHPAEAKVFANWGVLTAGNPPCTIINLETKSVIGNERSECGNPLHGFGRYANIIYLKQLILSNGEAEELRFAV